MLMHCLRGLCVTNQIPQEILDLLKILEAKGFESYLVGGCVRDMLLGQVPKDWDICTQATPCEMKILFPSCIEFGAKFGTIGVQTSQGIVEITTFREEGGYRDCRHPQVQFVRKLELDLKRRDFTINAMAYHPTSGLIDCFEGIKDLQAGVLRCVGEAQMRFQEDALRILRLVRFSCVLGFEPELYTLQSALDFTQNLLLISHERIRDELILALQGKYFVAFFSVYQKIFSCVFPELKTPKAHHLKNPALLFAFLLDGEESLAAMHRLKFSKEIKERVKNLLKYKNQIIPQDSIALKHLLRDIGYDCLMALFELKKLKGEKIKMLYAMTQKIMMNDECYCLQDLRVSGKDLLSLGFQGKEIGEVLESLLLSVIEEEIANQKEVLLERALLLKKNPVFIQKLGEKEKI